MHWGRRAWTRLSALINRGCGPSEMQPGWSSKDFRVRWSDCEAAGWSYAKKKREREKGRKRTSLTGRRLSGVNWKAARKTHNAAALAISAAWRSTFSDDRSLLSTEPALHNYGHQLAPCTMMPSWFLQECWSRLPNMISGEKPPVGIFISVYFQRCKVNVKLAPGLNAMRNPPITSRCCYS